MTVHKEDETGDTGPDDIVAFHALEPAEALRTLGVAAEQGLDDAQVAERRARYGANRLAVQAAVPVWKIIVRQLISPVVALLAAAMALSLALTDWIEAGAVAGVLVINTLIGFIAEHRAVRSMEALRRMDMQSTRVRRAGHVMPLPADELVPGDIVLIEAGDSVPADLRVVTASNLNADESALTGESVPVQKDVTALPADTKVHARSALLHKGTGVTTGSGEAVVIATAGNTELGRIAHLVESAEGERSPLEKRLDRLAQQLVWLTLALAIVLCIAGIATGQPGVQMLQTAIALAVAAIPEGLPIVATLALARGMLRMARRNALVRSLGAVETLGATTTILTDKTGTLTENRMTVNQLATPAGLVAAGPQSTQQGNEPADEIAARALLIGALCSNAELADGERAASGDPMEVALLEAAVRKGLDIQATRGAFPRTLEHAFDTSTRMMATVHRDDGETLVAVKGAPEAVLAAATRIRAADGTRDLTKADRDAAMAQINELADEGYRTIALAEAAGNTAAADPYRDLTWLGVAALRDPPRQDIPAAIAACHTAGIRVVMVTGDHPATARAIAARVGFDEEGHGDKVHARVTPTDKLDLVAGFQSGGEVVAMTGDGVNDAPALKKADIGIAMGMRGTDVAREAADMVLRDDAFSTVVHAIHEGRTIFTNIRRFCVYLLSCNLGEVLLIAIGMLAGLPLPLLPLQILFLNLITDVFPAFALATSEGDKRIGERPPRPTSESVLARRHWVRIAYYGVLTGGAPLAAYVMALSVLAMPAEAAQTIAFLTIGFAQLGHVFNMRSAGSWRGIMEIAGNKWVWGALALSGLLISATVFIPVLRDTLDIVVPTSEGWLVIALFASLPFIIGQAGLALRRRRHQRGS